MPNFSNFNDIEKYIKATSLEVIKKDVAKVIKEVMEKYVQELLYNKQNFNEEHYKRTFELLNCITVSDVKEVRNTYEVEVYFDTNKIHPYKTSNGYLNQHMSVTGKNVSSMIPYWMEEGHGGVVGQKPLEFIEGAFANLTNSNKHIDELKKRLRQHGIILT